MATLEGVNTKDWTLSTTSVGELVTDLLAIDQNLSIICTTIKGSDPVEIEFGVDLLGHLDKPVNQIIPSLIKDITEQVARYEKRAIVKSIVGEFSNAGGSSQVIITLTWKYYNETKITVIPFKHG